MNAKDEIRENIESDAIAEALAAYMEEEGEKIIQECAEPSRFELTREADRRLARAVHHELAAQRPRSRHVRRVLLVAALLAALSVGASALAFHKAVINFIIERHEKYLSAGGGGHAYLSMDGLYSPSYRPEGYEVAGNPVQHHGLVYLTYREQDGDGVISFQQSVTGTGRLLDMEHALSVESILIGESPGTLVVREDGSRQLLWGEGKFLLSASEAGAEELTRMAGSVALIGEEPVK